MSGQINVDVIQTSAGPSLGGGNATLMKNRIINGAMVINQRGFSGAITNTSATTYTLDRFAAYGSQASKFTVVQSSTAPAGFNNSALITSLSAYSVTSSDNFTFGQTIEGYNIADLGWGTANAKTVTLSFWVQSSLTGTFGGSLINGSANYSYPFTYTISSANTWTQISITIAGPTAGTWPSTNGSGMIVVFGLGVGSTGSGAAGSWSANLYQSATGATSVVGTNGATFYITGVQLEVGSFATGYEYRQYQQELALCQRYYWQQNYTQANNRFGMGTSAGNTTDGFQIALPVPMRTAPSVVLSNIGLYDGTSTYTVSSLGTNYSTPTLLSALINNSSSITAGKSVQLYAINSSASVSTSGTEL